MTKWSIDPVSHTKLSLGNVLSNPVEFIKRLKIIDKSGKLVSLKPNDEQVEIIKALEAGENTLILKGRQIGSSTIVGAYFFWKTYVSKTPTTFAILSHKLASSKHLLQMHKIFYENLPKFLQRPLDINNTTCLSFRDSGAKIVAVSAGAEGGIRSFTCSYLHISEYAFAPAPEELKATALAALNNGQLVIESTANFFGDALHLEWTKAMRGEASWKSLFFPWFSHKEYVLPTKEELELSDEEAALVADYALTNEQILWRRDKISKIGKDKFRREFPADLDDAYSQAGSTYFKKEDFSQLSILPVEADESIIFSNPEKDDVYAIGVDVAAGVGRDYSVVYVTSKKTHSCVAIFRSNSIVPVALAYKIQELATLYNKALVLVESNSFGSVVINELKHLGYYSLWTRDEKDWLTTSKSKGEMFENLKSFITSGHIRTLDMITYSELRALTVTATGKIEIPTNMDSHGDSAIACALSYICLKSQTLKSKPYLPNWIVDRRIENVRQTSGINIAAKRRY